MDRSAVLIVIAFKAGTTEFGGAAVNCMVRDMSHSGASPTWPRDKFTLVFQSDGHHAPCHIVCRKAKRIGVAFD